MKEIKILKVEGNIKFVSWEDAEQIERTRYPQGLFCAVGVGEYLGVDTWHGESYSRIFNKLSSCKTWLLQTEYN